MSPSERTAVARDLAAFVAASPTPYHAVAEAVRRLEAVGFRRHAETDVWSSAAGGGYLTRGGALIAWWQPENAAPTTAFRLIGAHTDSPTLKVKPNADAGAAGYRQVAVETYGGLLHNTWLDRDLGLAGRVSTVDGSVRLVDSGRAVLRVPQLAVHLDRSVNSDGLRLDPQQHLAPVWGLGDVTEGDLRDYVAELAGVSALDVAGYDLVVYDVNPPAFIGRDEEFLAAGRLDNLSSVHAGLTALLAAAEAAPDDVIPVLAAFDHEEVGSETTTGAKGPLLGSTLDRILTGRGAGRDDLARAYAASRMLSADAAHAAHPNYLERYEPAHRLRPNAGPALKVNANQRYATDAVGQAAWARACRTADVPSQVFVSHNAMPCGTTIGPLSATRLGIETVDVGIPLLSMHSARELCGADDPGLFELAAEVFLVDPVPNPV